MSCAYHDDVIGYMYGCDRTRLSDLPAAVVSSAHTRAVSGQCDTFNICRQYRKVHTYKYQDLISSIQSTSLALFAPMLLTVSTRVQKPASLNAVAKVKQFQQGKTEKFGHACWIIHGILQHLYFFGMYLYTEKFGTV
jgi:hypothetical protein